jgi:shikimate kinase
VALVVLVGLPGTGKSTIGRRVAGLLECEFVDTDLLIRKKTGQSSAELLRSRGEDYFREQELLSLKEALVTDGVVATGGGVVSSFEARELLKSMPTVWLDSTDQQLERRVRYGDRPLLSSNPKEQLATLRAKRSPWYEEVARARVMSSGSEAAIAKEIAALVKAWSCE